ncbi:MAG: D-alanine--D-alanine ligase [Candidatus Subteraquimicrobiales bacterium]|nr:D-alanine--D-alanine ligase [Candidatus Subteraquimicrobiales bacterium]
MKPRTEKPKVAVLMGGSSSERKISLLSGEEVYKNLLIRGYSAKKIDLDEDIAEKIKAEKPEVVFIALHGRLGEDGAVQGLLEVLGIPYTGSGVLASALCLNKLFSKRIFVKENIPTPPFFPLEKRDWQKDKSSTDEIVKGLRLPLVVKPVAQGSSVGVSLVKEEKEISSALEAAFSYDETALLEEYVDGREIQCGIIGNKDPIALPLIEIVSHKQFFDYEAKYTPGLAEEITPAPLSKEETQEGQELAVRAYKALGCAGFARVDMFFNPTRGFSVSEINTIPGLTANSLLPKEAKAAGIEFPDLIERIVQYALEQ